MIIKMLWKDAVKATPGLWVPIAANYFPWHHMYHTVPETTQCRLLSEKTHPPGHGWHLHSVQVTCTYTVPVYLQLTLLLLIFFRSCSQIWDPVCISCSHETLRTTLGTTTNQTIHSAVLPCIPFYLLFPSHFLPSAHTPLARSPAGFPLLSCCTTSTCILSSLSYAVPLHPILPHHSRSPTPIVSLSSFCPPSLFCLMKTLLVFIPIIGTFFNAYFTCKLRKKLQY